MLKNPLHYLASRIFLWFWLVILATVAATLLIARGLPEQTEIRRLPPPMQHQLHAAARFYSDADSLADLLQRLERRRQGRWLLVDPEQQQVLNPAGLPRQFDHNWLTELSDLEQPRLLHHSNLFLAGPVAIEVEGRALVLYQQRQRPEQPWWQLSALPQSLLLLSLFLISAIASLFLAISITRPLRELLHSYQSFAAGELAQRSSKLAQRNDELGALGRGFNAMAERISGLLQGQQRLLRDVSHELRTPLTRAQLALALEERQGEGKQLPRLQYELEQVDALLDELLTYSRLNSGHYPLELEPLDLSELLQQLVDSSQLEAQHKQQHISLDCPALVERMADKRLLSRALENILRNALKYSPAGSIIHCQLGENAAQLQISICDQGPGVPASELEAIFTPFYRVSHSRSSATGGFGLGLAIAAESVRLHGGKLQAQLNQPAGLCLVLTLPGNCSSTLKESTDASK
ncbi:ATP-binding protein [Alkalimonas sp.]|uniref:ATP-binding protein n=1 Tax=Alkalimonas sp. TaxID=1872453 RepID=UPI00263AAF69|nr:ATP-binding protein [Alkalimonas sp.]MCC5825178.1 HAMP domain-containing protein [Alkalimonas sp.]